MNLLSNIPDNLTEEVFEDIISKDQIRIERIVSNGHCTKPGEWYDQEKNEWVLILKGSGVIEYEDGEKASLSVGDHLLLPKGVKHRVAQTEKPTIWLAAHFD